MGKQVNKDTNMNNQEQAEQKKYSWFAFISYKSEDLKWAWWLKKKLHDYRLPAKICREHHFKQKPANPSFLDKTDIQAGNLSTELKRQIDDSENLIVICSPRSAESKYVGEEIEWFTRNGRIKNMFLFIIESDPKNIHASFHPAIADAGQKWDASGKREELGVNVNEENVNTMFFLYRMPLIGKWLLRERAFMQLISTMLVNVRFEQLWSIQKIRMAERAIVWIVGSLVLALLLFAMWMTNRPVDISAKLNEATVVNTQLPPLRNAIVSLTLDNETRFDTIRDLNDCALFRKIPHGLLGKEVRIEVRCKDYISVDTIISLSGDNVLNISRDCSVYGDIHFRVWNQKAKKMEKDLELEIEGQKVKSDDHGNVVLRIPLNKQKQAYQVTTMVPLEADTIYMPCGRDDVITIWPSM